MNDLTTLLVAILGSNVILEIVRWLIGRDKKGKSLNERFNKIEKKLEKNERDSVRTQLLFLISDYPDRLDEIMEVARHYFEDLSGNWFMTKIFKGWLEEKNIDEPDWLK